MQIACKRFGCQKAVEVCYWACKHRRNCKDWHGAMDGEPGRAAIQLRLEAAAAKSGRTFDAGTLVSPGRPQRFVTAPSVSPLTLPAATPATKSEKAETRRSAVAANRPAPRLQARPKSNSESKNLKEKINTMAKTVDEETTSPAAEAAERAAESKEQPIKPRKKAVAKPKQATSGTVYLLLSANGKYRELRESELMSEAAAILKDSSLRLVKGQFLVPQISFKPADE